MIELAEADIEKGDRSGSRRRFGADKKKFTL